MKRFSLVHNTKKYIAAIQMQELPVIFFSNQRVQKAGNQFHLVEWLIESYMANTIS